VTGVGLRGEIVESDVDSLSGKQRDKPRRITGTTASVGRDDTSQVAGLVCDDDRPQ